MKHPILRHMTLALDPLVMKHAVEAALLEDLGRRGDVTTRAIVPMGAKSQAVIVAREAGMVAGLDVAKMAFELMDPTIAFEPLTHDGAICAPNMILARVSGCARALLSAERVALNFMGRMSGIATLSAKYVAAVAHTGVQILDTRKTTPNLRIFEKYAVVCGGGSNHRFGLDDAVLIKDNHIAFAGGVRPAVRAVKSIVGPGMKLQVEVDTLEQLHELLEEGADAVLLDNMSLDDLARAVAMVNGRMQTEASGGVTLERVHAIAETGVDYISIGALTHSAIVLDVSLDIEVQRQMGEIPPL